MDDLQQFHQLTAGQRAALGLTAPAAFFVTGSDALQVSSWNALAGVTLTIAGRFRTLDGEDHPFVFTHAPNTNRTIASSVFPLGDGWIVNATVFVSAAAPIIGQTFVRLQIVRGFSSSGIVLATLAAGYVTAVQPVAWPGGAVQGSLDGAGAVRSIAGSTPGAGAEISEAVPTGARWELLAFSCRFVSGAAVANRDPVWTLDDGATIYARNGWNALVVASTTIDFTLEPGFAAPWNDQGGHANVPLPINLRLAAGHRIRTVTTNIQVADQYSAIQYLVREWLECAA